MQNKVNPIRLPGWLLMTLVLPAVLSACGSGDEQADSGNNGTSNPDAGTIVQQPDSGVGSSGDGSGLPGTDQAFIDQAVQRVNAARAAARQCGANMMPAQPALIWDAKVEQAALDHSQWMRQTEIIEHTGENGSSPGDRLSNAGYNWGAVAENIAAGYPDLNAVIDGWLSSEGHCVNIMSADVSEFAVALVNGSSGNTYTTYWTMVLADPL